MFVIYIYLNMLLLTTLKAKNVMDCIIGAFETDTALQIRFSYH